jgi:hypothetical protein
MVNIDTTIQVFGILGIRCLIGTDKVWNPCVFNTALTCPRIRIRCKCIFRLRLDVNRHSSQSRKAPDVSAITKYGRVNCHPYGAKIMSDECIAYGLADHTDPRPSLANDFRQARRQPRSLGI